VELEERCRRLRGVLRRDDLAVLFEIRVALFSDVRRVDFSEMRSVIP